MTKQKNPMRAVLERSEWPEPLLDAATASGWPTGGLEGLVRLGLLAEAGHATTAACDACGFDHVEPVEWVRVAGLPPRVCIRCSQTGVVWLDPTQLVRWALRLPALAACVAGSLGAAGEVREVVPGRVWKLGAVRSSSRSWLTFLAVGLGRPDGAEVAAKVPELHAHNALVLVPSAVPHLSVWEADRPAAVVSLCDVLSLGAEGLVTDRGLLESSLPTASKAVAKGPSRVFPTPPGTAWEQVLLTVGDLRLRVQVAGTAEEFSFAEAGFENRQKKGVPDDVWRLLKLFAKYHGELGTGDHIKTKQGKLKTEVSELRDRLQRLLALEGDPFHPTQRNRPYRTRFEVRTAGAQMFPTPVGAAWDDISLTETATGLIAVEVAAEGRTVAYVERDDQDGDAAGRWEGATQPDSTRRTLTPADLGLGTDDPKTRDAGEALLAVLRAGGRLTRAGTDAAMLQLGKALTDFFHIPGKPFEYDPKGRAWVAQFEAHSEAPGPDR
jgi:hypothetical protein